MFQLTPSDADLFWYLSRVVFVGGLGYMLIFAFGGEPLPSTGVDFWLGVVALALVPTLEHLSDSTPLHEEIDFDDE
ncbi:hypothetical protein RYH80_13735 [Halobaculum sp. MBLA0147]|uniref:hypothetical protein n=1 Tax=Halobaculum sp. MBLA0147 TaxID=3079934 RepID=UPI003525BB88